MVWTFDDGNASDMHAAEQLASAGLSGKFYVLSGRIGKERYLAANDLRELDSMGMEVGSTAATMSTGARPTTQPSRPRPSARAMRSRTSSASR